MPRASDHSWIMASQQRFSNWVIKLKRQWSFEFRTRQMEIKTDQQTDTLTHNEMKQDSFTSISLKPGGADRDQKCLDNWVTESLNTLNTDELYRRKEFVFSTHISMACFKYGIIGTAFQPNYKCSFFTYTENTQPGNLESFLFWHVTLQIWISFKLRSL